MAYSVLVVPNFCIVPDFAYFSGPCVKWLATTVGSSNSNQTTVIATLLYFRISGAIDRFSLPCVGSESFQAHINPGMMDDDLSEPSSPESGFDTTDLLTSACNDEVTAQLAASGSFEQATKKEILLVRAPRKLARTSEELKQVGETGLWRTSITLTPSQKELLQMHSQPKYLYLQGTPGSGKTVVLYLGAKESLQKGLKVVIVHRPVNKALAALLKKQLLTVPSVEASNVLVHTVDFYGFRLNCEKDVKWLISKVAVERGAKQRARPLEKRRQEAEMQSDLKVHIIVDEVQCGRRASPYIAWINAVHSLMTDAMVWMAGLENMKGSDDPDIDLPPWVQRKSLAADSMRCLPTHFDIRHHDERDHTQDDKDDDGHMRRNILRCRKCGFNVADTIQTHMAQPGHFEYKDVWILTGDECSGSPLEDDIFIKRLKARGVQVIVVETDNGIPRTDDGVSQLAFAKDNKVVVTDYRAVSGMERGIVFLLGGGEESEIRAKDSANSFLYVIK